MSSATPAITDVAGNALTATYNSGTVLTVDKTAPTITINDPNTLPAQSKTITAGASDGTLTMSNTSGLICDSTLTFIAYASQTFTSEADNGTRVCYRAVDTLGNTSYGLSNAIAGIDTTAPTITITEPNTLPATSKTITASASDGTLSMSNTTGATCDSTLIFVAYASQTFTSEADNGTRVCLPVAALQVAFDALLAVLERIQKQILSLERRIEALPRQEPEPRALVAMFPRLGAQSVATLPAELGDARRFRKARAVAAYAGLVPTVAQSADVAHHGSLTKQGNRELRWIVSQWAVRLMTDDPLVAAWAARMRRRMHRNKVRMALARRLLVGVWITLTRGEVFDLRRCLGRA